MAIRAKRILGSVTSGLPFGIQYVVASLAGGKGKVPKKKMMHWLASKLPLPALILPHQSYKPA